MPVCKNPEPAQLRATAAHPVLVSTITQNTPGPHPSRSFLGHMQHCCRVNSIRLESSRAVKTTPFGIVAPYSRIIYTIQKKGEKEGPTTHNSDIHTGVTGRSARVHPRACEEACADASTSIRRSVLGCIHEQYIHTCRKSPLTSAPVSHGPSHRRGRCGG